METLATLTTSETNAAIAGGVAGAMITSLIMTMVVWYLLTVIATWKIFKKAGEPGWKCLIPIYNTYIMYKIVGMKGWFWGMLLISLAFGIITAIDGTSNIFAMSSDELAAFDWGAHIPTTVGLIITTVAAVVVGILNAWRTSRVFGHGVGYFLGLLFLQPIFWLILGFGKSKYDKKVLKDFQK